MRHSRGALVTGGQTCALPILPLPLDVRRSGVVVVGRRSLSLASALPVVSASRTKAPIAAGTAGAATARSAVARPVSNAKRVSNNRKNRPYIVRSPDYCDPLPEPKVKVKPLPAFQRFHVGIESCRERECQYV